MTTLTHAAILTRRELAHWARQPLGPIFNLAFSLMLLAMFGLLFGGAIEVPGGDDYIGFLLPGLLAMVMMMGIQGTMMGMAEDAERGISDRFRSLPMHGSAVAMGRSGADMLSSALELVVLVGGGLLMGWRIDASPLATLAGVALLLWLRYSLVWLGIFLGLAIRGKTAVTAVQVLVWPIGFASNALVAPETMPAWLGTITEWNPISATATAVRQLFGNPTGITGGRHADAAIWLAIGWPALIIAVFLPLSARAYRRLGD